MTDIRHVPDGKPFQRSAETKWLIDRLSKMEIGEIVSYQELTKVAGKDVQKTRGPLLTARRALQVEQQMSFGCLPGIGIKRLDDEETVAETERSSRRTVTSARTTKRIIGCVKSPMGLPKEKRQMLWLNSTRANIVIQMQNSKTRKQIEAAVAARDRTLDFPELLRQIQDRNGGKVEETEE